jgi:hypothetical protein
MAAWIASPAWADQSAPAAKPDETYSGMVVSVNPNARTLEVKEFLSSKTFDLSDKCTIVLWRKPLGTINDLRLGEKVTVSYRDANGTLVANRILQNPITDAGLNRTIEASAPHSDVVSWRDGQDIPDVPNNAR